MSGGYKWMEIPGGMWQVVAEESTGRILANVITAPKTPPAGYVNGKYIGHFISLELARTAVEDRMSETRSYAASHAGRLQESSL